MRRALSETCNQPAEYQGHVHWTFSFGYPETFIVRQAFVEEQMKQMGAILELGLRWSRLVHVCGVDLLAAQSQLQNLDVLWPVEYLSR